MSVRTETISTRLKPPYPPTPVTCLDRSVGRKKEEEKKQVTPSNLTISQFHSLTVKSLGFHLDSTVSMESVIDQTSNPPIQASPN